MAEQKKMTNKEMIEQLQNLGVTDINPNATQAVLKKMLDEAVDKQGPSDDVPDEPPTGSDTDKILAAISGLAGSVSELNKRVDKIETGGKNDFMNDMKQADVDKAAESKSKADPRVVAIVEEILGVDFGVEILPNPHSPGFNFTVLVPQRLSPVVGSQRPIIDPTTGQYKKDEITGAAIEENYWPGDRRSRAVGSTDSFDLIRDHCNKVRAHIVTYYEKMKKPLPEFKLRG